MCEHSLCRFYSSDVDHVCRRFVELDGRYCLPVLNTHKRGLGVVHGISNSGTLPSTLIRSFPVLIVCIA
jgi:hypothetical protein